MKFMEWRIAIQTDEHDYVGRSHGRNIVLVIKLNVNIYLSTHYYGKLKSNKDIRTFLNFSSIYRWQTTPLDDGSTEIRLMDLRYLNNDHYAFVAIAHLTSQNEIDHSYIGWVFSEDKLQRKLFAK